ncbi:MAG TPA: phosphatidate cytidylyltransferase [Ilumatobacteraceae bacterium]|jgi:phosphatidate cytidylyltransferase
MSDDIWRRKSRDDDDFGPPLFGDPSEQTPKPALSFDDSTGPLPHWTEPPTGDMPRVLGSADAKDESDDLDVWSSFSGKGPVWSDDESPTHGYDSVTENVRLGQMTSGGVPQTDPYYDADTTDITGNPVRREPGRITIGTDPTDESAGRPTPGRGRTRTSREEQARLAARSGRPSGSVRTTPAKPAGGIGGRDMPTAIAVGAVLAIIFIVAIVTKPQFVLVIVVAVIGLAAVEFYDKVSEKGYQPASVVGIVACVAGPLAAYFYGEMSIPLVFVLAFVAGSVSFIGAPNLNSSPMPNMAITTLGITWIGLTGSFAGLFLHAQVAGGPPHIGTDTLLLIAIGVVVNDIGALFVGSAAGKTPLRGWISPNKSVEGFLGGAFLTIVAMIVIGISKKSDNWATKDLILLGVVIAIMAPLGDLTESMFKRNLDIKDFGSIIKGHGGVLDRFDGFLFTLPATYYLMLVLTPWIHVVKK